jgi:hypothetical protein
MQEIHDNLIDRIAEAEREGWLGEIEIHETNLAAAKDKLVQIDAELARRNGPVDLGMPSFSQTTSSVRLGQPHGGMGQSPEQ